MPPKKVLFLTLKVFGFTGGIEKVCRTVCRALYDLSEEELVDPTTYCMYDLSYDRDSRYLKKQQYRGFGGNRKLFVVKSILKGLKSDVVILSHINLLSIAYLIKRFKPSTKVYLIAHGIEIWRKLPEAKIRALKRLDKIIAVSHYTADQIVRVNHISEQKIEVLNNCLDPFYHFPSTFSKPESLLHRYGLHKDQVILMSLSRLVSTEKYKGYDNTIAILPRLVKNNPNLVYLLAGKSDEEEHQRLEKLMDEHQIRDHIKLIGFVDEAEITDHFLLSDIFVMPSKKEGFGIVFIEAVASGLSVVAGNKDGSVDALKNGELGYLVDPDNLEEIERILNKILANLPDQQQKINLQQKVLSAFGYENYRNCMKSLICNGSTIATN